MQLDLIPPGTRVEANGEGGKFDLSDSETRTFLLTLNITETIEQQSIDVSIMGSPDGDNWPAKPILKSPQRFYRGETRMILDLNLRPEIRFIRPRWELSRWGRVAPTPRFTIGLRLEEVPAMQRPSAEEAEEVASSE